eukprot:77348-Chlamydomonas_euryale.AAC.5
MGTLVAAHKRSLPAAVLGASPRAAAPPATCLSAAAGALDSPPSRATGRGGSLAAARRASGSLPHMVARRRYARAPLLTCGGAVAGTGVRCADALGVATNEAWEGSGAVWRGRCAGGAGRCRCSEAARMRH